MYFFIKLGRDLNNGERMDPIDFGGQRSKVKVTVFMYGNKAVNPIQTKPCCASLLTDMLTMVNPMDFGGHSSKVKVMMGIIDKSGMPGDATFCVVIF